MDLKPGARLRSAACETEIVVVRSEGDIDLRCGGTPMIEFAEAARATPVPPHDAGTLIGKRYADDAVEVLCTRGGHGSLSIGDLALPLKSSKPLPSSD